MKKDTNREAFQALNDAINNAVIGQEHVVRTLLLALLTNGNVLLEGLPGTAKTRSVKSLARCLDASLGRIQFTPDLLPSDVTGNDCSSRRARCSTTSCSPTRSTAPPPKSRRRCSRRWRSAR
jgi:MoxR-like ATPase